MRLQDRTAVIYGGGGPIGGAMARAFARDGATVVVAGRTEAPLRGVVDAIQADGGRADLAIVDALDNDQVDGFVDDVVRRTGAIDISVNVIGLGDVQQPLLEISTDDLLRPIATAIRAHFVTTRSAARHMVPRGKGVVLAFGGSGPQTSAGIGGFKIALDSMEGLRRQWAIELGPHGIRVLTIRTSGVPESIPGDYPGRAGIVESLTAMTQLGRAVTLDDVGSVAAFLVSDDARTITSTEVNISCGAIVD